MEFTLEELKRIYEFANWGVQKKGVTNKDFRSATEKLRILLEEDIIETDNSATSNVKAKDNKSEIIKVGSVVTIRDVKNNESLTLKIIEQSKKTHYLGYKFNRRGVYVQLSQQVLEEGGDGESTVSTQSLMGKALLGHIIGDFISYKNNDGDKERYEILNIVNE